MEHTDSATSVSVTCRAASFKPVPGSARLAKTHPAAGQRRRLSPPLLAASLLVFGTGGCDAVSTAGDSSSTEPSAGDSSSARLSAGDSSSAEGHCPPPNNTALLHLGCIPSAAPTVKTTGPCGVNNSYADPEMLRETILINSIDAGTCHIDVTLKSGTTTSVEVNFMANWRSLNGDPHGCGIQFVPVNDAGTSCFDAECLFLVPGVACDAGL